LQNNYQQANKQDTCGTGYSGPSLFDTSLVQKASVLTAG